MFLESEDDQNHSKCLEECMQSVSLIEVECTREEDASQLWVNVNSEHQLFQLVSPMLLGQQILY